MFIQNFAQVVVYKLTLVANWVTDLAGIHTNSSIISMLWMMTMMMTMMVNVI